MACTANRVLTLVFQKHLSIIKMHNILNSNTDNTSGKCFYPFIVVFSLIVLHQRKATTQVALYTHPDIQQPQTVT